MNKIGVTLAVVVFGAACFVAGQESIKRTLFKEFEPKFADDEFADYRCFVMLERDGNRNVYRGCWAPHIIEKARANWKATGAVFPYMPIAEFNRELDASGSYPSD